MSEKNLMIVAEQQAISISDKENPRSLMNILPSVVSKGIEEHLFTNPELFEKDERALWQHLRLDNKQPTPTDNRLRMKFWMEYDRAQAQGTMISIANVLHGVCSKEYFYKRYMQVPSKVAWLMCPPTGYMVKAEEALEFGLEQLRDILEIPHVNAQGRFDAALGTLKAKIVAMLEARVKGAVVQKQMNLNVNTSNEQVAKAAVAGTMVELQKQMKELEARSRRAQNLPSPATEVEPE